MWVDIYLEHLASHQVGLHIVKCTYKIHKDQLCQRLWPLQVSEGSMEKCQHGIVYTPVLLTELTQYLTALCRPLNNHLIIRTL